MKNEILFYFSRRSKNKIVSSYNNRRVERRGYLSGREDRGNCSARREVPSLTHDNIIVVAESR